MSSKPQNPVSSLPRPGASALAAMSQRPRLRRHVKAILVCPGVFAVLIPSAFLIIAQVLAGAWQPARIAALHPAPRVTGFALVLAGGALFAWTNLLFHRANGTLHPNDGPPALVTGGPYAWTRNPMIVGVFLMLGGVAALLGSWTLLGYLILFAIVKNLYIAWHEEPVLERTFGAAYDEYRHRVRRRWVPWPPRRR